MPALPPGAIGPLLGGLDAQTFLREYWQKKPLVIRQAVPGFRGFLTLDDMLRLCRRDDIRSRLVTCRRRGARGPAGARGENTGSWQVHEGPLDVNVRALGAGDWTVLVQGVESVHEGGWPLLQRFSFLPRARIDDLMVSYAAPGGGVGPHYDLYDVFLLQGFGRRRWRIGRQPNLALESGQPLKILRAFAPDEEHILEPGDMLYLPPRVAHEGTALEACTTYSIGFLAPSHEAIISEFLAYLSLTATKPRGLYADPDQEVVRDPSAVPLRMVDAAEALLASLRWDKAALAHFLGRMLTGPKPQTHFSRRRRGGPVAGVLGARGALRLALPSRMLHDEHGTFFLNGEAFEVDAADVDWVRRLAQERIVSLPYAPAPAMLHLIESWLEAGFVDVTGPQTPPTADPALTSSLGAVDPVPPGPSHRGHGPDRPSRPSRPSRASRPSRRGR